MLISVNQISNMAFNLRHALMSHDVYDSIYSIIYTVYIIDCMTTGGEYISCIV